jgi:hypothetical protein
MGILECGTPLPGVVLSSTNPRDFAGTKKGSKSFKWPQGDESADLGNCLRQDMR